MCKTNVDKDRFRGELKFVPRKNGERTIITFSRWQPFFNDFRLLFSVATICPRQMTLIFPAHAMRGRNAPHFSPAHVMRARNAPHFSPAHDMRGRNAPHFSPAHDMRAEMPFIFPQRRTCAPKSCLVFLQHAMRGRNDPHFPGARHARPK